MEGCDWVAPDGLGRYARDARELRHGGGTFFRHHHIGAPREDDSTSYTTTLCYGLRRIGRPLYLWSSVDTGQQCVSIGACGLTTVYTMNRKHERTRRASEDV
jgi:hypothetical protein